MTSLFWPGILQDEFTKEISWAIITIAADAKEKLMWVIIILANVREQSAIILQ
jgi:hypothetical protein